MRSGPIIGWKIFYADGSTANTDWESAPREGVQCILVYHPKDRRNIVRGRDEYTLPGEKATKLGSEIEHKTYLEICRQALTDTWRP